MCEGGGMTNAMMIARAVWQEGPVILLVTVPLSTGLVGWSAGARKDIVELIQGFLGEKE